MRASRRSFVASVARVAASPVLRQTTSDIAWKLTSAFPSSFDLIADTATDFCRTVSDLTGNQFTVNIVQPGDIASSIDALDAVADGKVDCAYTSLSYGWSKEPAYIFGAGVPFGMNARQQTAWLSAGGGNGLIDELLSSRNLIAFPLGDTGSQMAGWFRKEIQTISDFSGLRVRVGGLAGKVLEGLGAVPVSVPKEMILQRLKEGSLDGFEWVGPYDDERFAGIVDGNISAISKVAPYYYYPGWWKGDMQFHLIIAKDRYFSLPKPFQAALTSAAALANGLLRAKYDAANPGALKRLVVGGAQLRLLPQEVLEACYRGANELFGTLSADSAIFKKVGESYFIFRSDEYLWWQVAEYSFDNFIIRQRRSQW